MIHPTAIVDASVVRGAALHVGAFAMVEAGVILGNGCSVANHATVRRGCELGAGVHVDSNAVLGGPPQMRGVLLLDGHAAIGSRTFIREGVTVHLSTRPDSWTTIGTDCLLMAYSHVGHDCHVGDHVTLANNVMLAGHVEVGDGAFVGGGAGVHQHVRIGRGSMIGGNASISYDVPPFVIAAERNQVHGLNLIGLRRSRMPNAAVTDLKRCYHAVYSGPGDLRLRAAAALEHGRCGRELAGRMFLEFFAGGRRGFVRPRRKSAGPAVTEEVP